MQFSIAAFVALFAASAIACGTPGDQCNSPQAVDCQCNAGNLVSCQTNGPDGTGYSWQFYGDCPANGGGLECVNGACVVN